MTAKDVWLQAYLAQTHRGAEHEDAMRYANEAVTAWKAIA